MASFDDLTTPCLLLDHDRLLRNLARMQAVADRLGVALRPHLKTAKSAEVARLSVVAGAKGLTVSTLKEAEYFSAHGFTDLFYAVSIVGRHVPRLVRLARAGVVAEGWGVLSSPTGGRRRGPSRRGSSRRQGNRPAGRRAAGS